MHIQSELVQTSIEMRNFLTGSSFNLDELRRIYLTRSASDYFCFEKNKNRVQIKKRLQKHNCFL